MLRTYRNLLSKHSALRPGTIGSQYQRVFLLCLLPVICAVLWSGYQVHRSQQLMSEAHRVSEVAVLAGEANAIFKSRLTLLQVYVNHPAYQTLEQYRELDEQFSADMDRFRAALFQVPALSKSPLYDMAEKDRLMDRTFYEQIVPKIHANDRVAADLLVLRAIRVSGEFDLAYEMLKGELQQQQAALVTRTERASAATLAMALAAFGLSLGLASWFFGTFNKGVQSRLNGILHYGNAIAAGQVDLEDLPTAHDDEFSHFAGQLNLIKNNYRGTLERLNREIQENTSLISDLESKNTELERFTYTVSHDLKSPLITIKGFVGMALEDLLSGRTVTLDSDLHRVEAAAERMSALLEDLLNLSRIGRISSPKTLFPMTEVVQEVLELLHGRIEASGAVIRLQPDLPRVSADRFRIMEVWQNLLENALKYAHPDRPPEIRIFFSTALNGRDCFIVDDNGIGVDPADRTRVFELFEKLDPKTEGTGIGLTIVKRILEVHGGELWTETPPSGIGARFCFTLPGTEG